MNETFEPLESDILDEDLYFILDEENLDFDSCSRGTGYMFSSGVEWPSLESDESEAEEVVNVRLKTRLPRKSICPAECARIFGDVPVTTFRGFVGVPEEPVDGHGISTHIQNFSSELKEGLGLSSKHKDYRRFRYYDLIRSKLNIADKVLVEEAAPEREKVHFNAKIGVHEFDCDDILGPNLHTAPLRHPSSILLRSQKRDSFLTTLIFTFRKETFSRELRITLKQTYDKFTRIIPSDLHELQALMILAKHQACAATENVLCAFEGVSTMGKYFIGVINRLQASATRFLVLSETHQNCNESDSIIHKRRLCECLARCEELQRDILLFKNVVLRNEEHMAANSRHISTSMRNTLYFSRNLKEIFGMVFENDESSWTQLHAIISVSEAYTKCINFLAEMTPERVFRFLKHDFTKMQVDIANVNYFCGLLLDQTRKSITESQGGLAD